MINDDAATDASVEAVAVTQRTPTASNSDVSVHTRAFYYQGPLPPAAELERIHHLNPQCVDRIFGMAERQQAHHIALETSLVQKQFRFKATGQWMALGFALAAIAGGGVLVCLGHDWAGVGIGATPLAGVVGLFVTGRRPSDTTPTSSEDSSAAPPEDVKPEDQPG